MACPGMNAKIAVVTMNVSSKSSEGIAPSHRDERGDTAIRCLVARGQAGRDPGPVGLVAVLAHLARAFEAGDRQAQPDDAAQLGADERLRRIGYRPRLRT